MEWKKEKQQLNLAGFSHKNSTVYTTHNPHKEIHGGCKISAICI